MMGLNNKWKYTLPDGRSANFSLRQFKEAMYSCKKFYCDDGKRKNQTEIIEDIADGIATSSSAVKHWLQGHNSPSDFNKVESLAQFLGVAAEDLLIFDNTKEDQNMSATVNTAAQVVETPNFASAKDAVKNIYAGMVGFIEMFRMVMNSEMGDRDTDRLQSYFIPLYTSLMLARLDIPHNTYHALCSFAEDYLQLMAVFASFVNSFDTDDSLDLDFSDAEHFMAEFDNECVPWWSVYASVNRRSEDGQLFNSAMQKQYRADMDRGDWLCFDYCNGDIIIETAYARLGEILADYMAK